MKSIGSTLLQNFKHRVSTDQNGPNAIYLESMTKLTYARDMIRRVRGGFFLSLRVMDPLTHRHFT